MPKLCWTFVAAFALMAMAGVGNSVQAQGSTTGAIAGFVRDSAGNPLSEVQIRVTNRNTGFFAGTITRENGRFQVSGLEVGTNYLVEARRIGYGQAVVENIQVTLGQISRADFTLQPQATQLGQVTITATGEELVFSPSRRGVGTTVSDTALRRLPSLNRNFTDFVVLTPQVSTTLPNGGLSGGGVNNRFNHIQIDGASETDLFGLGSTGQPGGQAQGKSIGIESVKEYQVLLTPFDVRQGNFAGLLINAVTRSGSNNFEGTIYGYGRDDRLTRDQPFITEYQQAQYGVALGGPIVRDRLHFFVNPEFQRQEEPARGLYLGAPGSSLQSASVDQFRSLLEGYGITDIGSAGQVTNENPLTNIFARIDAQLSPRTSLVARHNYGFARRDVFSRGTSGTAPDFPFTSNLYNFKSTKNSSVIQLRTRARRGMYNEFIAAYNTIRDRRAPNSPFAQVTVSAPGATLVAGAERFSHANELDQDVIELTNNFSWTNGDFQWTVGALGNWYQVRNLFRQSSLGVWRFGNLDSLALGLPNQYIVGIPIQGDGAVRFRAGVYAAYLQNQWTPSPTFSMSAGIRADMPIFNDRPPVNNNIWGNFGYNTSDIPTGNIQFSPRISFNWDMTGDSRNQLRGGVGLFTGHPAYVWLSNAFQNSGLTGVGLLTCTNPTNPAQPRQAPNFSTETAASPPQACRTGQTAAASAEINLLAPSLRFPQTGRISLGYDRDLGRNLVATAEVLTTVGVYSPFYENIALRGPQGVDPNGRVMYGPRPNQPVLNVAGRQQVFLIRNNHMQDRSYNLTAMVRRRYADNWEGSASYTYSRAWDVQSLTSSTAFSNVRFGRPWAGNLRDQSATKSAFEQPHRIVLNGSYSLPTRTTLSLIYTGESGTPFTYVSSGDLNGDALTQNDPIYVPRSAANPDEIRFVQWTRAGGEVVTVEQQQQGFDEFISGLDCLNAQRGQIMTRNACRTPFSHMVNMSVRQALPTFRTQNVSVQLDIFNLLNLMNEDWGRRTFTFPTIIPLTQRGVTNSAGTFYEGGGSRPTFEFDPTQQRFNYNNIESNYQLQLSLRYSF